MWLIKKKYYFRTYQLKNSPKLFLVTLTKQFVSIKLKIFVVFINAKFVLHLNIIILLPLMPPHITLIKFDCGTRNIYWDYFESLIMFILCFFYFQSSYCTQMKQNTNFNCDPLCELFFFALYSYSLLTTFFWIYNFYFISQYYNKFHEGFSFVCLIFHFICLKFPFKLFAFFLQLSNLFKFLMYCIYQDLQFLCN